MMKYLPARIHGIVALLFLAATLAHGSLAHAWDSICYEYDDPHAQVAQLRSLGDTRGCGESGARAARGRWRDPHMHLDEHRALLEHSIRQAGLPEALLETVTLVVPTGAEGVPSNAGMLPSVRPVWISAASNVVRRSFSLDELAQLPDFSFSGFDWLSGNEECPRGLFPGETSPEQCHLFKTHMGALNASHFPPQSDEWFDYYHAIALARAAECRAMRSRIWTTGVGSREERDARFRPLFRQCEVEALAAEAIAQHFLQDSWAAGHMWNRWGSAAPGSFSATTDPTLRLVSAEIVAGVSGTIHGSDPVTFELYLDAERLGVPAFFPVGAAALWASIGDAMTHPHPRVQGVWSTTAHVTGDLHLHDIIGGLPDHQTISAYPLWGLSYLSQRNAMVGCTAGAVSEVYQALGDSTYGPPTFGRASRVVPFIRAQCVAPMATNAAIDEGIDRTDVAFNLAQRFGTLRGVTAILNPLSSRARDDYGALRYAAQVLAKVSPDTTEMAQLHHDTTFRYRGLICPAGGECYEHEFTASPRTYTMLGVEPNRCYSARGDRTGCTAAARTDPAPATFADPQPPFVRPGDRIAPTDQPRHVWATAFNAAHQLDLCPHVRAAEFANLRSLVARAPTAADRRAACDLCETFVQAHLRIGAPDNYDRSLEPLCAFSPSDGVEYLYEAADGTSPSRLARRNCGCNVDLVAVTDAGVVTIALDEQRPPRFTAAPPVPVGALPRDAAIGRDGTVYVANGAGQIVGVRAGREIDLNGIAEDGVTRVTLAGATSLQGVATTTRRGRALLLAASRGTGELIAWDLDRHTECGRVRVARVTGEEAYDVAVASDGSTAYVTTRQLSPISGAIAVVDLDALAACDPASPPSVTRVVPPGAPSALSSIALSPNGARLAVGMRLAGMCPDLVDNDRGEMVEVQVGCDGVFIMDARTREFSTFGVRLSLPTRPGRYAYGVSWFPDSRRVAYTAFSGVDLVEGWPARTREQLPVGGTLRLGDVGSASYAGGGGDTRRHWTYNVPLDSPVLGETVSVSRAGTYVFVATAGGRVAAYPVAPHDESNDPMWEASEADPEWRYRLTTSGSWYGGCRHRCVARGGWCPNVCPTTTGLDPPAFGSVSLGSPVRVLIAR